MRAARCMQHPRALAGDGRGGQGRDGLTCWSCHRRVPGRSTPISKLINAEDARSNTGGQRT